MPLPLMVETEEIFVKELPPDARFRVLLPPPRLTLIQSGNEYTMVGNGLLKSQYDHLGRRYFVNLTYAFE